jgi:hypothetical protein
VGQRSYKRFASARKIKEDKMAMNLQQMEQMLDDLGMPKSVLDQDICDICGEVVEFGFLFIPKEGGEPMVICTGCQPVFEQGLNAEEKN